MNTHFHHMYIRLSIMAAAVAALALPASAATAGDISTSECKVTRVDDKIMVSASFLLDSLGSVATSNCISLR